MSPISVMPNLLDKTVMLLSPKKGLERLQHKARIAHLEELGYVGASKKRKSTRGWNASGGSADSDDLPYTDTLRFRSRDRYRNDGLVTGAINTKVISAVGTGLTVQSQVDYKYLKISEEEAIEWEERAEREFNFVAKSKNADASRTQTFYDMQFTAMVSMFVSGDVFALMPKLKRKGAIYQTALALVEADRVCNENDQIDSNELAGGIRVNELGEPIEYHIMKQHPYGLDYMMTREWVKVPAYGKKSGRLNVIHLFKKVRPGQRRGVPVLAPVLEKLKQLDDYTNAELTAALISGLFTVFLKSDEPAPEEDEGDISLTTGGITRLYEGEDISLANPNRPNTAYDPFTTAILRQVAIGLDMPYEVMIKHFQSSYTSARASFLEAWRMYKYDRALIAKNFCQPFYEAVIEEAVLMGRLDAPGFMNDSFIRKAYLGTTWSGPSAGQINEKVETEAAEKRVENGFSTSELESANINGTDYATNMRRKKRENQLMLESTPKELRGSKRWAKDKKEAKIG
jgi:lambda family phage portal protein